MLKYRHFLKELLKVTLFNLALIAGMTLHEFFDDYLLISWISLAFFFVMTAFTGYYNSRSIGKPFFINIFLGTLGIKFLASLAFIAIFFYSYKHVYGIAPNKFFVIPFLIIFAIYKVFETLILLKYSKEAKLQHEQERQQQD